MRGIHFKQTRVHFSFRRLSLVGFCGVLTAAVILTGSGCSSHGGGAGGSSGSAEGTSFNASAALPISNSPQEAGSQGPSSNVSADTPLAPVASTASSDNTSSVSSNSPPSISADPISSDPPSDESVSPPSIEIVSSSPSVGITSSPPSEAPVSEVPVSSPPSNSPVVDPSASSQDILSSALYVYSYPGSGNKVLAATADGLFISLDGGKTFLPADYGKIVGLNYLSRVAKGKEPRISSKGKDFDAILASAKIIAREVGPMNEIGIFTRYTLFRTSQQNKLILVKETWQDVPGEQAKLLNRIAMAGNQVVVTLNPGIKETSFKREVLRNFGATASILNSSSDMMLVQFDPNGDVHAVERMIADLKLSASVKSAIPNYLLP